MPKLEMPYRFMQREDDKHKALVQETETIHLENRDHHFKKPKASVLGKNLYILSQQLIQTNFNQA